MKGAALPTARGRPRSASALPRRRLSRAIALFAMVLGLPLAACGGSDAPEAAREEGRILVLAASSLQFALPEIVAEFERRTGTGADMVFGSSGSLVAQIESGAPADLFLSADRGFVDRLEQRGLTVPGSIRPYATGRIALVVPPGQTLPAGLADLTSPAYAVIALANPETAPYGLAARQALESAGLWIALQPRLVYSENIAQAAQFVRTGNADAGLLALPVVLEVDGWAHRPIDPASHSPIVQAGAVIADGPRASAAAGLLELIASPAGAEILSRYGFGPPGG